jgi:serine/threonine protein kinase
MNGREVLDRKRDEQSFNNSYSLGKVLGSGAFSVVKLGTQKSTGKKVAVKIVKTGIESFIMRMQLY